MKSIQSALLAGALFLRPATHPYVLTCPWLVHRRPFLRPLLLILVSILVLLASCSSLGKPERQPSPAAPACNQREPARDSADPPDGAAATDWMAWAQAYVASQWAIVDRDNKRAATADCLDELARIKP